MTEQSYLSALADNLRQYDLTQPTIVLDLDRLDANIAALSARADRALTWRLVSKSLPSLDLLRYLTDRMPIAGFMTFSTRMLRQLLDDGAGTDHLLGKPFPVAAAAQALEQTPQAIQDVQWLIDSSARLSEYATLAAQRNVTLRISLEIDVGLHRGGFDLSGLDQALQLLEQLPNLQLTGLMGYDAHLPKLPSLLRTRAARRVDATYAAAAKHAGADLCLNGGGSMTFDRYRKGGTVNDIAFGSILVKPSDFDTVHTKEFVPAAFIATPILKTMQANPLPGLDFLPTRKSHMTLAVSGGYFKATPIHPPGFRYSGVFGRSSNQEVWTGKQTSVVAPDAIALLHPSQSEAVLNQFGSILTIRGSEVMGEWSVLTG